MDRQTFLAALTQSLARLPAAEIEKAINYYHEIFDDRLEEGMSETEIIAGLEPVEVIAQRIIDETPMHTLIKAKARSMQSGNKALNIILLVLGFPLWFPIVMSLLAILLTAYIVIWSLILVLFSIVLALGIAALAGIFGSPFGFAVQPGIGVLMLGGGLLSGGLTILAFFIALYGSKGLIRLTVLMARGIRSLFLRKKVD